MANNRFGGGRLSWLGNPCGTATERRYGDGIARVRRATVSAIEALESRRLLSVNVTTYHYDNSRDGLNPNETILTPANVNAGSFGVQQTVPLDGAVYAQPLYLSNLTVPGKGAHNVVFVCTENDSVYAVDSNTGTILWKDSLLGPGETAVSPVDVNVSDIEPVIGITGTPVIDPGSGTLYVVAKSKQPSTSPATFIQRLYALNVATGANAVTPVVIQATAPGTGDGSVNGVIPFDALTENQRPGLTLDNGVVYVSWSSHGNGPPVHGWVIGYNAATLAQTSVFITSPNSKNDDIWMAGAAPAVDSHGNLLLADGNGTFDVNTGGSDYGDTLLKLSTTNGLSVADYFTPDNQATRNTMDLDLGSGGIMILPPQPGPYPDEGLIGSKDGTVYLVNLDHLGGYSPTANNVIQSFQLSPSGVFSTATYFNGSIYFGGNGQPLEQFSLSQGLVNTTPVSSSPETFGYPGTNPIVSSDGSGDGIVWALTENGSGALHAYLAGNLSDELYSSNTNLARDNPGPLNKFTAPVVAGGHVFVAGGAQGAPGTVASTGQLTIYGLLGAATPTPTPAPVPVTLKAAADAYVRDGSYARTNFGSATQLLVKNAMPNGGYVRTAYLKFNIGGVNPITAATLDLYGAETAGSTETAIRVTAFPVANSSWSQSTIDAANAPAVGTIGLTTVTVLGTTQRQYQFDLTQYLQQQQALGQTSVSVAIEGEYYTNGTDEFNSTNASGTNYPKLALITSAPAAPSRIAATADAYVRDGPYATQNYGSATQLVVKDAIAGDGYVRIAYLQFNLAGIPPVTSAVLQLYGAEQAGASEPLVKVAAYPVASSNWSESSIDYANAPAIGSPMIASVNISGSTDEPYALDLTSYVQQQIAAGLKTIDIALEGTAFTSDSVMFNSRHTSNGPALSINSPTPTATRSS